MIEVTMQMDTKDEAAAMKALGAANAVCNVVQARMDGVPCDVDTLEAPAPKKAAKKKAAK